MKFERENLMTDRWFTDAQVLQVALDLLEEDRTMADAMDMDVSTAKPWGDLSSDRQQPWLDRATARLAEIAPLDLSRPLRLRDGTPVTNVRLSDDGLNIVADVPAWRTDASWPRDGMLEVEHPSDLIYAEELAPVG